MPRLERWIQFGNVLVGYLFDHRGFSPGTRVKTDHVIIMDISAAMARCRDGDYKLGEPGTAEEHNQPLIKAPQILFFPGKNLGPSGGPNDAA